MVPGAGVRLRVCPYLGKQGALGAASDFEQVLDVGLIGLVHITRFSQVTLLLGLLLGEDVIVERLLALHFASAGERESLLGT